MADMPLARWTRRGWLAGGAGLVISRRAVAQTITAGATLQKSDADQDSAGVDSARLAARTDTNSHLMIEVMINGRGPYHFVIDTGAERSVIADNVAALLALPRGDMIMIDGIADRVAAPTVHVNSLSFGPFTRSGLTLPILPRISLFADGYLGLDAINGTRVTFDFKNHALHVEQPKAPVYFIEPGTEVAQIRAKGSEGRLRVTDCLVDSVAATAFIDTGAEVSVGNLALYDALKSRNKHLISPATMTLTGVTGGQTTGDIVPVRRIRLQELNFTDGLLVIADVPDFSIWKLVQRPALLIGMDYLRQFAAITIDYRSKQIRFELSLAPPNPRPGVEVEHRV